MPPPRPPDDAPGPPSAPGPGPGRAPRGVSRRTALRWAGLAGIAGLGGAGLVAACTDEPARRPGAAGGGAEPEQEFDEISVQVSGRRDVTFAGGWFAAAKGYWTSAGFPAVELLPSPLVEGGSLAAVAAVAAGEAWVALSDPLVVAPAVLAGSALRIVGATYQRSERCVLSLADDPVTRPDQLVGRTGGVRPGDDAALTGLLAANGIDPSLVRRVPAPADPSALVDGGPGDGLDALVCAVTAEPVVLAARGTEAVTMLLADQGYPMVSQVVVVSQGVLDDSPDAVRAFLGGLVRGWKDAVNDPEGSARFVVEDPDYGAGTGLDYERQVAAARAQLPLVVSDDTLANGLLTLTRQAVDDTLASLGLAGVVLEGAEQLFDLGPVTELHTEDPALIDGQPQP